MCPSMWWDNKDVHTNRAGWTWIFSPQRVFKSTTRASKQNRWCCPAASWSWGWRSCRGSGPDGGSGPAAAEAPPQHWRQQTETAQSPSSCESSCDRGPTAAAASGSSPSSPGCRLSPAWSWAPACETPSPGWLWAARCSCWCGPCAFSPRWVFLAEERGNKSREVR